ncbi:MAG: hypothetical protein K8R48_04295 [Alphaproteobacteria bacterium]|nr:hypothetical protein [Alphaproteobacteria bacterium]
MYGHAVELFILCTPQPLPAVLHDEIRRTLSTWGYDLLEQGNVHSAHAVIPRPASHTCILALASQDLQPDIRDGVNQRVFKAARSLGRQLKKQNVYVLTPKNNACSNKMLHQVFPQQEQAIREKAKSNLAAFQPPYRVLKSLNNHTARARIDIVDFNGREAVCKTFRQSARDYLQREIQARAELGAKIPEIAPILEQGGNYFVMPLYRESWRWEDDGLRLYPLERARQCMDFLRRCHTQGYAVVDAHPGAFLFDGEQGLRVADLEYLMPLPDGAPFEKSFDIVGPPPGFTGILPAGRPVTYQSAWRPVVGVSLRNLMTAPPLKLRLLRALHWFVLRLPKFLYKKLGSVLHGLYSQRVAICGDFMTHWPRA